MTLEIGHFDVIFRMNWLSRNGATIHCLDKCVIFLEFRTKRGPIRKREDSHSPILCIHGMCPITLKKGLSGVSM